MTGYTEQIRRLMPDFVSLGSQLVTADVLGSFAIRDDEYLKWLCDTNGGYAYQGALRFFPLLSVEGLCDIATWNSENLWKSHYGRLAPRQAIFCEDAFGQQFMFDQNARVSIFWSETAEVESLGYDFLEFLQLISENPDTTISFDLYDSGKRKLRPPNLSEHFAFKVEPALGGTLNASNLTIVNSIEHMRSLGQIAKQIADLPVGTKLTLEKDDTH